jgi:hypothetical protein
VVKTQVEVVNKMRLRLFIFLVLFAFAFAQSPLFAQNTCNPPCPNPCAPPCPSQTPSTTTPTTGGGPSFEISPYSGFVWTGNNNGVGQFQNNQLLGVRGGAYVTSAFEIGGNWSWNNHFQPESGNGTAAFAGNLGFTQAAVRSNLWEMEFTYHFGSRGLFGHAIKPYVVAGAGGITTNMKNGDFFVLNNTFIDVPGVSPATLAVANSNGTLQSIVPGVNTSHGVAFTSNAAGTGSTVIVANDVLRDNSTFFTFSYGGGLKLQRVWGPLGFFGDIRGRAIPNFFNGHGTNLLELTAGLNFAFGEQ